MIARGDVNRAFELCLGRELEADADYAFFCALPSLQAVYATIFASAEFQGRLSPTSETIGALPLEVEVEADARALERMVSHVEATWDRLGRTEPHWSVITDPRFKQAQLDTHRALYDETGRSDEAQLAASALRAGIDLARFGTCFELGCGTGRVTAWLARRFPALVAMDISPAHLDVARSALRGLPNVELVQLRELDELDALRPFDVLYSRIVLQHNPPPVIAAILRRLLRRLRAGGIAYFQVPVWIDGYRFRVADYLEGREAGPMEMHALPQRDLLAIVQDAGCRLRELREDPLGPQFGGISNTLLVEKA